jgi:hypothetical protein
MALRLKAKKSERPVYAFQRVSNSLVPEMSFDLAALDGIAQGERVRVEIKQWRNSGRMRLYWKMLSYVREATECAPTSEALHSAIKLELGFGTPVRLRNGMTVLVPASISFEAMEEQEFVAFLDRAVEFLSATYGFDALGFYKDQAA